MPTEPDLFVICKNCSSEVSPYITECPYCGARLRKRAPKIERYGEPKKPKRVRRPPIPAIELDDSRRPYVTIAIVGVSLFWLVLLAVMADAKLIPIPDIWSEPWRLPSAVFVYLNGWYEFACLLVIAIYGWRLEARHGPLVVLALFILGGLGSLAVVNALDRFAIGGNGLALCLVAAWSVADLLRMRAGEDYDGDLIGTGILAALVLLMPVAVYGASEIAGLTGAVVGLAAGVPLARLSAR